MHWSGQHVLLAKLVRDRWELGQRESVETPQLCSMLEEESQREVFGVCAFEPLNRQEVAGSF